MYRILVVDDDEEITTLLSQYMERFGFEVHVAHDGASMHSGPSRSHVCGRGHAGRWRVGPP